MIYAVNSSESLQVAKENVVMHWVGWGRGGGGGGLAYTVSVHKVTRCFLYKSHKKWQRRHHCMSFGLAYMASIADMTVCCPLMS